MVVFSSSPITIIIIIIIENLGSGERERELIIQSFTIFGSIVG